jgi:hypothetical protein
MKYGGELFERWKCGTWFEHIGDGIVEGNRKKIPVSTQFRCREFKSSSKALHKRFI